MPVATQTTTTYSQETNSDEDAIKVMTGHASKGMEFPVVFIIDIIERKFPSLYIKDKFIVPSTLTLVEQGIQSNLSEKDQHIQEERKLM